MSTFNPGIFNKDNSVDRLLEIAGVKHTQKPLMEIAPPEEGRGHGTTDGGPPTSHTEHELGRVYDLLYLAHRLGGADLSRKVFRALPDEMKMEFNYAKWNYRKDNPQLDRKLDQAAEMGGRK